MVTPKIKRYTKREEFLNALTHLSGIILAFFAWKPLWTLAEKSGSKIFSAGIIVYWLSILMMYSASSCYHLFQDEWIKIRCRKFDHIAIYWLITGTYAPLMLGALHNRPAYWLLGALFALSIAGTVGKLCFANKFHKFEVAIYLLMGWCCLFVIKPLYAAMPPASFKFLLAGGIVYSVGTLSYILRREFAHAAWHLFVLGGTILQYFAILTMFN
jgi:hemolysin III